MALQALGAYAEKAYSSSVNMTINVQNGPANFQLNVNPQNGIVLQSIEVSYHLKNIQN
jgi:carbamoylphosphate synthase large subunit